MNTQNIYDNLEVIKIYNNIAKKINCVKIDTRKITNGDCYIGIKGEKNDGNLFYMEAFKKGAEVAILDNYQVNDDDLLYLKENNKSIVVVKNSIQALGELAKYKRSLYKSPVVAITGSVGKTSTKDLIYSVLKEKYNAHKTIGNQNNQFGLPLTILALDEKTEMLVLEMGMNHLGEISYLTNIAKPDVAVITNVGTAHIGNLGSRENILKAKLEILEGLNESGTVVINNDNDLLHEWYIKNKDKYHIITIGINNTSDFEATNIVLEENSTTFTCKGVTYEVPVGGEPFIYNALVAIAVASIYNIPSNSVKKGIINFELSSNRMNIINDEIKDITLIDDSYNANFDSMSYAIKYLGSLDGRLIAVLGTMKELGKYSEYFHRKIGKLIYEEEIDILITVGDDALYINNEVISLGFNINNSYHFDSNIKAAEKIKSLLRSEDRILVKASNSLNFKEIVDFLKGEI